MSTDDRNARTAGDRRGEPESLAQLRGDCARVPARWHRHETADAPARGRGDDAGEPARPHGVHVPERSAHLLDGMSDYGD